MYRFDTSVRGIGSRYRTSGLVSRGESGTHTREACGCRERSPVGSARAGRARPAARDSHARLRAAEAAELVPWHVPRVRLRFALPLPQGPARPGPDRGGTARHAGEAAGRAPVEDRLPADRGGQGAAAATARRAWSRGLGGRRFRRPVRLLRPDPRGHQAAHPGRPPDEAGGAAGRRPGGDGADQGTPGDNNNSAGPPAS